VSAFGTRVKGRLERSASGARALHWLGVSDPTHLAEMRRLFTTFGFLVAQQGATAVIGLFYWAVSTHLFDPQAVGLSAAAASTALTLSAFGALGVPLLLIAEIEVIDPSERRIFFSTGSAIAGFVVLLLAIGTVVLSPWLGKSLHLIGDSPTMSVLFVLGCVGTVTGLALDGAAVGLHRAAAQLWRGSLSSVLKLAVVGLLVVLSTRTATGLIFAWTISLFVAFCVCMPMLQMEPSGPGQGMLSNRTLLVRRFGKLSLQHHVLNLSISSVSFIVPLTATLLISPADVAYFSAAYLLSATLLIIPYLLALSLFAERSGDPALLHRNVRRTLPIGLALSGLLIVVVEIAAPYALRLFGPAYAAHGTTALRILILVGPAYVIKDHYVSIRRAQHRMSQAARIMAIGTAAEVGGAALGGVLWGLDGICIGWAVSASIEALAILPTVIRVTRPEPAPDSSASSEGALPSPQSVPGREPRDADTAAEAMAEPE
jgi:O-antigen/teichoic acid export membrane protein